MYMSYRYAGKLKVHKPNLIPESEFHIREERVKAQQSDSREKEKDESPRVSSKDDKLSSGKSTPTSTHSTKVKEEKPQAEKGMGVSLSGVKVKVEKVACESTTQSPTSTGGRNSKSHSPSEAQSKSATKEKGSEVGKSSSLSTTTQAKSRLSTEVASKGQLDGKGTFNGFSLPIFLHCRT